MKKQTIKGYTGKYWQFYWTDEEGKYNNYGKGIKKLTLFNHTLPIYKTKKDGVFPIATGYPVKIEITIKQIHV